MASWKKLIVSGSDAELATVCTSGGVTGAAICSQNYFLGEGLCGTGNICITGDVIATDASLSTVCTTSTIQSDTLVSSSVVAATTLCGFLDGTAGSSCCSCLSCISEYAGLVNIYSSSLDSDHLVTFVVDCTGCNQIRVDDTTNDFKYNPSTNLLTVGNVYGSTLVCSPEVYGTEVRGDLVSGSTVYAHTAVCTKQVYGSVGVCGALGCFDNVEGLGGCFEASVCAACVVGANLVCGAVTCSPNFIGTNINLTGFACANTVESATFVCGVNIKGSTSVCGGNVYGTYICSAGEICGSNLQGDYICSAGTICSQTLETSANAIIGGNLNVGGNFVVDGDFAYLCVTNLAVEDRYILLNSGSIGSVNPEGGIVIDAGSGTGPTYFYDAGSSRWGFCKSFNAAVTGSAGNGLEPEAFAAAVVTNTACCDTGYQKAGNIFVCTNTQDIYIWS